MSKTAIKITGLSVLYDEIEALKDISLEVEEGDYLAIMGPNGGGKSTLLKAILGLSSIDKGDIKIFGESIRKNRHLIGYVPQISQVDKGFPITLREVVLLGTLDRGLSPFHKYSSEDIKRADKFIELVGLKGLENRRLNKLSGGEFQKVLIARALITNPKILLLDEPTASIDAKSSQEIYKLLGELNKDITILLVTHNVLAISLHIKELACLNRSLVYHGEPTLTEEVINKMYGCPVEIVAHGVPHRVLKEHEEG